MLERRADSENAELEARVRTGGALFERVIEALGLVPGSSVDEVTRYIEANPAHLESSALSPKDKHDARNYKANIKRNSAYNQIKRYLTKPEWDAYRHEQMLYKLSGNKEGRKRSTALALDTTDGRRDGNEAARKTTTAQQPETNETGPSLTQPLELAAPPHPLTAAAASTSTPQSVTPLSGAVQVELQSTEMPPVSHVPKKLRLFGVDLDV